MGIHHKEEEISNDTNKVGSQSFAAAASGTSQEADERRHRSVPRRSVDIYPVLNPTHERASLPVMRPSELMDYIKAFRYSLRFA